MMIHTVKINSDKIRNTVREAARKAFSELRRTYPSDDFYYFVLWTTDVVHPPAPCACSKQGLEKTIAQYSQDNDEVSAEELRWSEADSPYDGFGLEYFDEVKKLFNQLDDPYDRSIEENDRIFEAIIQAMADLDREGFFGIGVERDKIVINVTMPGDESEEDVIERAKMLNPSSALVVYEKDLLE